MDYKLELSLYHYIFLFILLIIIRYIISFIYQIYYIYQYNKQNKDINDFIYNKDWDFLDYTKISSYDDYRKEFMNYSFPDNKLRKVPLNAWKEKIWLLKWYEDNGILGPEYIDYTQSDKDIITKLELDSYCVKPSHLSEMVGVSVVKDNILIKTVEYDKIKDVSVPPYFSNFRKGYEISPQEIYKSMIFLNKVKATWEDNIRQGCGPGYIIEKLREFTEIKIFVLLGKVIAYYYMIGNDFDLSKVFKLAEKTARASGIDFVRIDIISDDNNNYRVSEFTFNPAISAFRKELVYFVVKYNFHKLIKFHNDRKEIKYLL